MRVFRTCRWPWLLVMAACTQSVQFANRVRDRATLDLMQALRSIAVVPQRTVCGSSAGTIILRSSVNDALVTLLENITTQVCLADPYDRSHALCTESISLHPTRPQHYRSTFFRA